MAKGNDGRVVGEMTGDLLVQDELRAGDARLVLTDSSGEELEQLTASPGKALPEALELDVAEELKVCHSALISLCFCDIWNVFAGMSRQ